jgi:hypothetical protein
VNLTRSALGFAVGVALSAAATAEPTRDRTVLPIPEPERSPSTVRDVRNATAPPRFEVKAPEGAPNVIIILIDDLGFAGTSAYGGPISTPTFDRLAGNGVHYNNFHTTAVSSPNRAAIKSGRNHHRNNMGGIIASTALRQRRLGLWVEAVRNPAPQGAGRSAGSGAGSMGLPRPARMRGGIPPGAGPKRKSQLGSARKASSWSSYRRARRRRSGGDRSGLAFQGVVPQFRSGSFRYFVPFTTSSAARPSRVTWNIQTPGETEIAPSRAAPCSPYFAAALA